MIYSGGIIFGKFVAKASRLLGDSIIPETKMNWRNALND
jgi:hypothetical protein